MFETILWIIFVVACCIVSFVILLQEGKGGGLGEAFGGAGQQTFGVKAAGINRFTGAVSLVVVVIAIAITLIRSDSSTLAFSEPVAPLGLPTDGAPAEPGGTAPAGGEPAPAPPTGEAPAAPAAPADGAPAGTPSAPSAPPADSPPAAPAGGGGGR